MSETTTRTDDQWIDHEAAEKFVPDHVKAKLAGARQRAWRGRVKAARGVLEEGLRTDPDVTVVPDDTSLARTWRAGDERRRVGGPSRHCCPRHR